MCLYEFLIVIVLKQPNLLIRIPVQYGHVSITDSSSLGVKPLKAKNLHNPNH